jgi:hypothetical protein
MLHPGHCVGDVSSATRSYNCFAWAAQDNTRCWVPDPWFQYYWPDNVPRTPSIPAFLLAYGTLGYEKCDNGDLEYKVEKIAIYSLQGVPTHVARQLPNGNWTTKFGGFEDVEHINLDCLTGPKYGETLDFMKRLRASE